jgi:uncharacterized membrane protein YkoI
MRRALIASLASLVAFSAMAPGPADARRGGREDRDASAEHVNVSREDAIATARELGLARLHEVKLRDGRWEVEGWREDGRRIEVEVHAHTGAVVKHEVYPAGR